MHTPALLEAARKAANSDPKHLLDTLLNFFKELRMLNKRQLLDAYNAMKFIAASAEPDSEVHRQAMAIVHSIRCIANNGVVNVFTNKYVHAAILEDDEFAKPKAEM